MVPNEQRLPFPTVEDEIHRMTTVVRVWDIRKLWIPIAAIVALSLVNPPQIVAVPLTLLILWCSTYFVRQRWRISLTDKQIVAQQLFPRPLTTFSRTNHFPLHQIEGLSVGPRTFETTLLVGLFISTNVGVNLLKSGLSVTGADLPDTLEFVIFVLKGVPILASTGDWLENACIVFLERIAPTAQVTMGITFICIGLVLVFLTIPRRHHLMIRVRHGADFRLAAGIPKRFWQACYRDLYGKETYDPPAEYRNWRFPWLEGEETHCVADLEQTIYANRVIGTFAIIAGTLRIWISLSDSSNFENEQLWFWLIVALADLFIAFMGIRFSKRYNQLVVTNERVIFAQEMGSISGTFGRRLFFMSDLRREDVAGFDVRKLSAFSFLYLIVGVIVIAIGAGCLLQYGEFNTGSLWMLAVLIFGFVLLTFTLQTYLGFTLRTKGGEQWNMRHQLANPMTVLRQIVGDTNPLVNTLLANRLEEPEVIHTMQVVRSQDLGMPMRYACSESEEPSLEGGTDVDADADADSSTDIPSTIQPHDRSAVATMDEDSRISVKDLLFKDEEEILRVSVPKEVPKRLLTLALASLVFLSAAASIFIPVMLFTDSNIEREEVDTSTSALFFIAFIAVVIGIVALWMKYYSLRRASLVLTSKRVFYEETRNPPWWLFIFGVFRELIIHETLSDQLHSTYVRRQIAQSRAWRGFVRHILMGTFCSILFGLTTGWLVASEGHSFADVPGSQYLRGVAVLLAMLAAYGMAWHAGNATVEMIRAWPRRVFNARGIAVHYSVPYMSREKAESASYLIWSGMN